MPIGRGRLLWMCLVVAAPAWSACAGGHPIPESERWATITHAGNAPFLADVGGPAPLPIGRVDYEFQISRTEITGSEWFEFVQAYAPFVEPRFVDLSMFTSYSINWTGGQNYVMHPAAANRGVEVGWWFAARYANWLHNDKALTPEAFENGAYDTSTFGYVEGYGNTDQVAHHPDAKYWIPTLDEWIKSAHFDPNRYGEGKPGYWTYSTSSEEEPIGGPVELGGETSAGYPWLDSGYSPPEVAGYRDVQSPWGLWDVSGGVRELMETALFDVTVPGVVGRLIDGSEVFGSTFDDRIEVIGATGATFPAGLRLARAVPTGGSVAVFALALTLVVRRRRIGHDALQSPHRI